MARALLAGVLRASLKFSLGVISGTDLGFFFLLINVRVQTSFHHKAENSAAKVLGAAWVIILRRIFPSFSSKV